MNYEQSLEYIHSFLKFKKTPERKSFLKLLELLDSPHKKLKFVHIAGTNGKGSTTAMLANILIHSGYKTGMYISPFIIEFSERMQINGKFISHTQLSQTVTLIKELLEANFAPENYPTEFEIVTATAMCFFAKNNCDIVVLEVGLGGRLDATNVISPPLASVICSVALDHTEVLGETIEKVAAEKSGIIKTGAPVVAYPQMNPAAFEVVRQTAKQKNCELVVPNLQQLEVILQNFSQTKISYQNLEIEIPLLGEHQIYNCITAVEAAKILSGKGFAITAENICKGVTNTRFPARFERVSAFPCPIIVDGAHNPDGFAQLAKMLAKFEGGKIVAVTAMMADKDVEHNLKTLSGFCSCIVTTTPSYSRRAMPADALKAVASRFFPTCFCCESPEQALNFARSLVASNDLILVCGSLYLASDIRKIVLGTPENSSLYYSK